MSESKTEAADAVTDKDAAEEVVDVEVVEVGARDNTPLALACVSLSLSRPSQMDRLEQDVACAKDEQGRFHSQIHQQTSRLEQTCSGAETRLADIQNVTTQVWMATATDHPPRRANAPCASWPPWPPPWSSTSLLLVVC